MYLNPIVGDFSMCKKWVSTIGIVIFSFLMCLAACSTSSAQTVNVRPHVNNKEKTDVLQEIRSAQKLLAEADHDYDGHRAKALAEVHTAINAISGNRSQTNNQSASAAASAAGKHSSEKKSSEKESQEKSDAQLQQAQTILQGLQQEVATHHSKASRNVNSAITEINAALSKK
jgi:hypothetical protein